MKKLLLLFTLICVSIFSFSQFPGNQGMSNRTTLLTINGGLKASVGFINTNYPDTASANAIGNYIKSIPGSQIRTGNKLWMRDSTATKWLEFGVVGSSGVGTVSLFGAGDLLPLFTTTETNASSTPVLSFTLNSQGQNLFFGGPASGSGLPTFRVLTAADFPANSPYAWQKTLDVGSVLNKNNTIDATNFDVVFNRVDTFRINGTGPAVDRTTFAIDSVLYIYGNTGGSSNHTNFQAGSGQTLRFLGTGANQEIQFIPNVNGGQVRITDDNTGQGAYVSFISGGASQLGSIGIDPNLNNEFYLKPVASTKLTLYSPYVKSLGASGSTNDSVLVKTSAGQVKAIAQTDLVGGGGGDLDSVNAITVKDVAGLRAVDYHIQTSLTKSGNDKLLVNLRGARVAGDDGGGQFYWSDTSTHVDDTAIYVKPTSVSGAGRWVRIIEDNTIRPEWWLAKGDGAGGTDDYIPFKRMLDFARTGHYKIELSPKYYMFNTGLVLDMDIDIHGMRGYGTLKNAVLYFRYPQTTKGITIKFSYTAKLTNLIVQGGAGLNDFDVNHTGIDANSLVIIKDVHVFGFAGHGIYLHGDGGNIPPDNVDRSYFENVRSAENRGHGWYIIGADANIISFINCEAVANGGGGVIDKGFLGNYYENFHTASNSSIELTWSRGLVKHDSVMYYCIESHTSVTSPDLDPTHWKRLGYQGWVVWSGAKPWVVGREYLQSHSYAIDNANAFATLINCYIEGDGMPSRWGPKCIAMGGTIVTNIESGLALTGDGGYNLFLNQSIKVSNRVYGDSLASVVDTRGIGIGYDYGTNSNGFRLGWNETYQIGYFRDNASFGHLSPDLSAHWNGPYIGTTFTNPNSFGRTAWAIPGGNFMSHSTYLLSYGANSPAYNFVGFDDAAPTTGTWEAGDTKWYVGSDTTLVGFQCIVTGTPGTWRTIKSGNAVVGGGGGNYIEDQVASAQAAGFWINEASRIDNVFEVATATGGDDIIDILKLQRRAAGYNGVGMTFSGANNATLSRISSQYDASNNSIFRVDNFVAGVLTNNIFSLYGSEARFEGILRVKESTSGTPASGYSTIYPKTDGLWYGRDDAGTETKISNDGGGVTTLAAIGSSPNANGATISGVTLNLEPASASFGGVVTAGTQSFAGAKTFNSAVGVLTSPLKDFHVGGTVRFSALGAASGDTTTYKPLGITSAGDIFPMTHWPVGAGGGGTPGGSTTQIQYNNAGAFGGITGATTNGTVLTMSAPVANNGMVINETTGAGVGYGRLIVGNANAAVQIQPENAGFGREFLRLDAIGLMSGGTFASLRNTGGRFDGNAIGFDVAANVGENYQGYYKGFNININKTLVGTGGAPELYGFYTKITQPASSSGNSIGSYYNVTSYGSGIGYSIYADSGKAYFREAVGLGVISPTARLHIGAGTATASTAPLKFTSGTHLGTIEDGAVEFNGTHLYISIGGVRYQLDQQGGGGTPGGSNTQLQYNNSSAFGGISGATTDGTNVTYGSGNLIATSPSITTSITTGSSTFALLNTTATTVNAFGATTTLNMGASATMILNFGGSTTASEFRFLEPSGSGTNYTAFKAVAQAASLTYSLPPAFVAGGVLTDLAGNGVLTWVVPSGGGGGTVTDFIFTDANGFDGTVSTSTTTPTLSITTTVSNTQLFYSNSGAVAGISGATSDGTNVTFGSGNLRATSPRFTTSINDANGNESFILTATSSAVNEVTFANAATGANPKWTASGGDTNVGLDWLAKGTGTFNFTGNATQASEVRFYEDTDNGTNYTAFKVGSQSANLTYTLPTAYPTGGNGYLVSTTAGVQSWALDGSSYIRIVKKGEYDSLAFAHNDTLKIKAIEFPQSLSDDTSLVVINHWIIELGDETTNITTGTAKYTFRVPFPCIITAVRASVNAASTSGIPTFDINEEGTTILSTKLTIDANEESSTNAATPYVISDGAISDDAEITIDIDVAGTAAKGAKIIIYYRKGPGT